MTLAVSQIDPSRYLETISRKWSSAWLFAPLFLLSSARWGKTFPESEIRSPRAKTRAVTNESNQSSHVCYSLSDFLLTKDKISVTETKKATFVTRHWIESISFLSRPLHISFKSVCNIFAFSKSTFNLKRTIVKNLVFLSFFFFLYVRVCFANITRNKTQTQLCNRNGK